MINVEIIQLVKNYLVSAPTHHSSLPNNGKSRVIKSSINDRSNMIISYSLSLTEFQTRFFLLQRTRGNFWANFVKRRASHGGTCYFLQHMTKCELHWAVLMEGQWAK